MSSSLVRVLELRRDVCVNITHREEAAGCYVYVNIGWRHVYTAPMTTVKGPFAPGPDSDGKAADGE
ncbi:hypothetical protein RGQ21_73590 [Kitasatospora aureofaciens]|nr:hypothetical protein RGQ21_73590 [Kitasatospora aureofaciens]